MPIEPYNFKLIDFYRDPREGSNIFLVEDPLKRRREVRIPDLTVGAEEIEPVLSAKEGVAVRLSSPAGAYVVEVDVRPYHSLLAAREAVRAQHPESECWFDLGSAEPHLARRRPGGAG